MELANGMVGALKSIFPAGLPQRPRAELPYGWEGRGVLLRGSGCAQGEAGTARLPSLADGGWATHATLSRGNSREANSPMELLLRPRPPKRSTSVVLGVRLGSHSYSFIAIYVSLLLNKYLRYKHHS